LQYKEFLISLPSAGDHLLFDGLQLIAFASFAAWQNESQFNNEAITVPTGRSQVMLGVLVESNYPNKFTLLMKKITKKNVFVFIVLNVKG